MLMRDQVRQILLDVYKGQYLHRAALKGVANGESLRLGWISRNQIRKKGKVIIICVIRVEPSSIGTSGFITLLV